MSDTLIENLFAPGDTPSGQYARFIGALHAISGKMIPTQGLNGSIFVGPGFQSGTTSGEFRVASPAALYANKSLYAKDTLFWNELLSGSATSTFQSNRSCVRLQVTTTNGDRAVRQTKPYISFEIGRSHVIEADVTIGAAKTNVTQRVGFFDDNNGIFLQQTSSGISFVTRTAASGSPVDTAVAQNSWNLDPLNGSGSSGQTLDLSKLQKIFFYESWPGVAGIAFVIGGIPIPAHLFFTSLNVTTDPFIATPVLPVRYEILNTGATSGNTFMDVFATAVSSVGGNSDLGIQSSASTGTTARTLGANATLPLLAVRMKSAYARGYLYPLDYTVYQTGTVRDIQVSLLLNASLTGGAWASASTAVEANSTATAVSGGTVIDIDYTGGSARFNLDASLLNNLVISSDYAGTTLDTLTVQVTNLTASTVNLYGALSWQEVT